MDKHARRDDVNAADASATAPVILDGRRRLMQGAGRAVGAVGAALLAPATPSIGAVATALIARRAAASDYPSRTVQMINPFPPGGPSDILARLGGESLHKSLGQPFVVENRPGAGGNIGTQQVARANADGYTLLVGIDTTLTINPHIYRRPGFSLTDFRPVIILASSGLLLGVSPATGFRTLGELVDSGRQKALNFSTAGPGSPGHLSSAMLQQGYQVKATPISYKGNSPAVAAVASGEVDAGILATPGMLPQVKAGRIVPLAVTGRQRSALLPEVLTTSEAGFDQVQFEVLYLVLAPAATPQAIVDRLAGAFNEAMDRPAMVERMQTLDLFREGQTGEAASRRLADVSAQYQRLIDQIGLKVE